MVSLIGLPGHPFADGVIVYTAVPATVPVVVNVWAIIESVPATAPVTPVSVTVHEKIVPGLLLVKCIEVALSEHIVWEDGVAWAVGAG